jgi:hypothetical protein
VTYVAVGEVADWLGIKDPADNPELSRALASAGQAIDAHCGYGFSKQAASARVFRPDSPTLIDLGAAHSPISSLAGMSVAVDLADSGTYATSFTDWQLEPLNLIGEGGLPWAGLTLRAVAGATFPMTASGRATVQITAPWGWPEIPAGVITAELMLTAAWHQRRATITGRGGFDGFFASAIADDNAIADQLAPYRAGRAIVGMA